ncbi:hypothetical protein K438DRAFT_1616407, partial [Mycena galopus ATCC 62051]
AGGLWTATKLALIKQFACKPELHTPALLWFSASSAADVGITVGLVWTLVSCLGVLGLGFRFVEDAEERARGDGWTGCFVEEWSGEEGVWGEEKIRNACHGGTSTEGRRHKAAA